MARLVQRPNAQLSFLGISAGRRPANTDAIHAGQSYRRFALERDPQPVLRAQRPPRETVDRAEQDQRFASIADTAHAVPLIAARRSRHDLAHHRPRGLTRRVHTASGEQVQLAAANHRARVPLALRGRSFLRHHRRGGAHAALATRRFADIIVHAL